MEKLRIQMTREKNNDGTQTLWLRRAVCVRKIISGNRMESEFAKEIRMPR